MHGDFPGLERLYGDPASLSFLKTATLVESRGYGRWTRLREVAEFARLLGLGRVGIAHAADMTGHAGAVAAFLATYGIEAVLPPGDGQTDPPGPIDQAELFGREGTEMNIVAGMGVASEAVFLKSSKVPSVVLFARDRRLRHNPAAALYTSRSYLQDALHGHWPPGERAACTGGIDALKAMLTETPPKGEDPPPSRLEEAMSVAHSLGASHLGFSFCSGFREEARMLQKVLEVNGFRVSSACCKTGATPKEEIGIREDEKVRPGRPEMICNPVAQAEFLNRAGVQFAFVLGQCVGHDAATFRHLEAPAACLVAKDRVLAHNPVAALMSG